MEAVEHAHDDEQRTILQLERVETADQASVSGRRRRRRPSSRRGSRYSQFLTRPAPVSSTSSGGSYILVGEPEKALDQLEPLLKIPYFLSPGWLKIDPNFDPLRKNPRFQKLIEGAK